MILKTKLYEHQQKAYDKLIKLKVGALYMEMGTGKTRTALELISDRLKKNKVDKVLWLCPCSTKSNLKDEISIHTDLGSIDIVGIETLSSSIKENNRLLNLVKKNKVFLVIDESNLVKNHHAKRTERITKLSEYCKYKLILNGTPITRNEKDLFAQWYILDWRILGYRSFYSFARNHLEYDDKGRITDTLNVDYLIKKISLYSYQVKKDECLKLKNKNYKSYYHWMTGEQCEHYNYVVDEMLSQLDEYNPSTIYRMFSALQCVVSGFRIEIGKKLTKSNFFDCVYDNPRIKKMLESLKGLEGKVIIFAKYVQEIKDITYVIKQKYGNESVVEFYGEISKKNREKNRKKFKENDNVRFFVSNKNCGGYGLNLQFCSTMIFYSNDFDYATRIQAEDRIHRIGQSDDVLYIDIACINTIDTRIIDCLSRKSSLVNEFKKELKASKDKKFEDFYIRKDAYGNRFKLIFNESLDKEVVADG